MRLDLHGGPIDLQKIIRGKQLFGREVSHQRMKLLESRPLASGSVLLRYEPYAEAAPQKANR